MATITLEHPAIGKAVGNAESEDVAKYLGIQYATLADRFSPPQMKQYTPGDEVDATKNGPQVLALPNGADFEYTLLQQSLDYDRDAVRMSDIDGLNLNIFVPNPVNGASTSPSSRSLPVFAFIHGGGFNGGSSSFPAHELTKFVRLSIAKGTPIIAVSMNYRLGAPGYLYSSEMKNAGYLPNNGFRDQRTALLWLQKYIGGFGGNPNDVTLMGQSAGAVSTAVHLHSEQPLFKRAMLMAGSTLLMGPAPEGVAEANYQKAVKLLELDALSPYERVRSLLEMDGQKLRATLLQGGVTPLPVIDGEMCPVGVDFKSVMDGSINLPAKHWCDSLLIGDCAFDGSILGLPLGKRKAGIAQAFVTSISASLSESTAASLLSSYGVTSSTTDEEAFTKILEFANDTSFYAPTLAFAQGMQSSMPVYVYRFNEPNTWPGPWQGRPSHIHDLVFLLQNFNQFMSDDQRKLAEGFAHSVIDFVNNKAPWQSWTVDERAAKVLKVGSEGVAKDVPEQTERRSTVLRLADEVGFDALKNAFTRFLVGG